MARRRRTTRAPAPHRRPLRIEPLEDRRLLSITVNTLVDELDGSIVDGDISLRDAIVAANTIAGADTIEFDPTLTAGGPATILLTMGELAITDALTINGPGANLLTIDASGSDPTPTKKNGDGTRALEITANSEISGLTITGGDTNTRGGGIRVEGKITLVDVVITDNATSGEGIEGAGGGIFVFSLDETSQIQNSVIGQNSSIFGGGVFAAGKLTVTNSVVSANKANRTGGGIEVFANSTLELVRSTVSGNTAGSGGGGIYSTGIDQPLGFANVTATDCTISFNSAAFGGGIYTKVSHLIMSGTTISGNQATLSGGGIHNRGDVFLVPTYLIQSSTITGNVADSDFDGFGTGGGGVLFRCTLTNSIIAGNFLGTVRNDVYGGIYAGFSLIGVDTGATINSSGGNLIGTAGSPIAPRLAALASNGGPTLTHALLPGSPALDAGDPAAAAGMGGVPEFDQRGMPWSRVVGGRIDMGAFESQANPLAGDYNFNGVVDAADYTVWRDTLGSTNDLRADGSGAMVGVPDGVVDGLDYDFWKARFGNVLGVGGGASAEDPHPGPLPEGEGISAVEDKEGAIGLQGRDMRAQAESLGPRTDSNRSPVRAENAFGDGHASRPFRANDVVWARFPGLRPGLSDSALSGRRQDHALMAWLDSRGQVERETLDVKVELGADGETDTEARVLDEVFAGLGGLPLH